MEIKLIQGAVEAAVEAVAGQSILDVLHDGHIDFRAPCGGNGTCGKCRVLVKTDEGFEPQLACQTEVVPGMEIVVERKWTMNVQEQGVAKEYPVTVRDVGAYGVSVDVGTTTVVCHLHDLATGKRVATASCENPQSMYGGDVISRINVSMNDGLSALRDLIVYAIDDLVELVCGKACIERAAVVRMTLVGNTVMEHIAAGLPPDSIGAAPFLPLSLFGCDVRIGGEPEDLGANCRPRTFPDVYFAPAVAGYVGGDITAGVLAAGFFDARTPRLFIDVGTNGEMVLGSKDRLISCATASGPAFEGAGIEFGMPAAPGAISRVGFTDGQVVVETVGGVAPIGICGSGLIDAVALAIRLEVIDETGRFNDEDEASDAVAPYMGVEDDSAVFYLTDDHSVYLTQKDVRNVQLAKAAVCAGVHVIAQEFGIAISEIDELMIAGGFGNFIDLDNAACIGLFPQELYGCARAVGNAAGEGASALLVSDEARLEIRRIAEAMEYIELSTHKAFNGEFVDCMSFE